VEFGLRARGLKRAERRARASEALELVGLSALAGRRPHELSGGQRQRVALARSLASQPPLILLDEPLANLDPHLRLAMQGELRRIHASTGTTFIFVTHDQREALALADQVAVMDRGRLQQVAPAEMLYRRPATPMVAAFVGGGRCLAVDVVAAPAEGERIVRFGGRQIRAPGDAPPGPGWLCLRPEDVALDGMSDPAGGEWLPAQVVEERFEGAAYLVTLALVGAGGALVEARSKWSRPPGTAAAVGIAGGWVLPRETPGKAAR